MLKRTVFAILMSVAAFAQQKTKQAKPAAPAPGVLSGRVFLITAAGDLKPARLAKVILFQSGKDPDQVLAEPNTVGRKFAESLLTAMEAQVTAEGVERSRTRPAEDEERFEKRMCRTALQVYSEATVATLKWMEAEGNKADQLLYTDADEEGNFKIIALPGSYILLASGRAGFNDAAWWKNLTLKSGEETTVKLANPVRSCLDLNP